VYEAKLEMLRQVHLAYTPEPERLNAVNTALDLDDGIAQLRELIDPRLQP
jgi:hypothetical protein